MWCTETLTTCSVQLGDRGAVASVRRVQGMNEQGTISMRPVKHGQTAMIFRMASAGQESKALNVATQSR
jgi:hypothetical protein